MRQTTLEILRNKLTLLDPEIYQDKIQLPDWEVRDMLYVEPVKYRILSDWRPIHVGETWEADYDRTLQFRTAFVIPESYRGRQIILAYEFGGEGLVRINGELVSSVVSYDSRTLYTPETRSRIYIPLTYQPGDRLEIVVDMTMNFQEYMRRSYVFMPSSDHGTYRIRNSFMACLHTDLQRYWYDLDNVLMTAKSLRSPLELLDGYNPKYADPAVNELFRHGADDSFLAQQLMNAAVRSVSLLEFDVGRQRLLASLPAAQKSLDEDLKAIRYVPSSKLTLLGHSHIDTAWLWRLKDSARKIAGTMANTFLLFERYPEMTFSCSQPQLMDYLEKHYPELHERTRKYVDEGRIELVGNSWVEADANVPSGEALVRQLLYGRAFFLSRYGKCSDIYWMPDVFGYSWALPQIIRRSGIRYFYTSKLRTNDTTNFPHTFFRWQGVDGTQVTSYLQRLSYNGNFTPERANELARSNTNRDLSSTGLNTLGFGDGGGGMSFQIMENVRSCRKIPGLPECTFGTASSFFQALSDAEDSLPVWNDEMYYEFHRGTYSAQSNTKKNNRKAELALRRTEIACSMASALTGAAYPMESLTEAWKIALVNQFHDILPGSSISVVYDECDRSYAKLFRTLDGLYTKAVAALNGAIGLTENQIAVWNFLPWERGEEVTVTAGGSITDLSGNAVPCVENSGRLTFAADVPALGAKVFCLEKKPAAAPQADPGLYLENEYLRVELNENGLLTSVFDKSAGREALEKGQASNLLTLFEDIPHREAAWNIDLEYQNHFTELRSAESVKVLERSALRTVIRTVFKVNASTITQDLILGARSKRVDFVTTVDWQERNKMLKAGFYVDILSSKATYEIQYGSIERPNHWNTDRDKARFEVCGHKWADLSEGNYGVSLLNDSKYGYDILGNRMRLTLLRSPDYPDPRCEHGIHAFTYSLYPHSGDWRVGGTVREAYSLNEPLQASAVTERNGAEIPAVFASVDMPNVVLESIKQAEDGRGFIFRLYESQGSRVNAKLTLGIPALSAAETNLMEEDEQEMAVSGSTVAFFIKPYEIKTFRIAF